MIGLKGKPVLYFLLFISFLLAGLLSIYFSSRQVPAETIAGKIAERVQDELKKADADFEKVSSSSEINRDNLSYPVFIFERNRLIYWSDNTFVPSIQHASDTFNVKLISTGSEAYLLKKKVLDKGKFIVSVIKLLRRYPINNDYLSAEFNPRILPSAKVTIFDPTSSFGVGVCGVDGCYFRLIFLPEDIPIDFTSRIISLILLSISLILFLLFLYSLVPLLSRQYPEAGFLILLIGFLVLRGVMTISSFPENLIISSLFDPQIFASSSLNASLGDLFINLLATLALSFFVFRNYFRFRIQRVRGGSVSSWIASVFCGLVIFFAGLFPAVVIQTLYNNSTIVIDISQSLRFDGVRVVAIFSVLISGMCSFLFSHAFMRTLIGMARPVKVFVSFLIAGILFSMINELTNQVYIPSLVIVTIYFLTVFLLRLYKRLNQLSFGTFAYLIVSIFFLAINGAFTIQYFTQKEKIENQFRFASNFLIDRDYFAEYLLDEASQKIKRDGFIQNRIVSPFFGKEAIRQKIRQIFLSSYFNKYDIDIYIFNAVGDPVEYGVIPLSEFIRLYDKDAYRTQYEGIRFIDNPGMDVAQKYLVILPINRNGLTSAHIIIQLSLKKIIPQNVYPELLVDYSYQQFYRTQDLSYSVNAHNRVALTSGEFNYERFFDKELLGNPSLYTSGLSFANYDHIAVEDPNERVAVVSAKHTPFIHKLANFSFLLALGLFIILIMIFIQGIFQYFRGSRLFFSARIQLYLNLAFFIPLIVVSISTLSLTSKSSQQQLNDEYLNKSRIFSQQLINFMDEYRGDRSITLENRLSDLAKLSNLDANIYNRQGYLMASSQPLIFENNLLSQYVNPAAYERVKNGENLFVESEKVGKLEYFVSYSVLKSSQSGNLLGILGIPFFQSAYLLEKIQSVILINILNIFAFIFIILLLLSYVVAERLTFPLRFITQSLRRTSLTKINTPLTWAAEDEIGLMVKEYNSMLYKLGESKSELEQTQREKAWREIAQQVAHEIKNPLTPMKLTLQQLERALQSGNNTTEKTQKAILTLLGQVDTLNDIASSFSGFVKMPEPVIQKMEIVSIVKRALDLHSPTGEIQFKTSIREAWVHGDPQLLSRTFSNIILNALQSARPGQNISVQILIESENGICRIIFRDNGKGINSEIADRVFQPHFSTKKSGSGLGLAIARQGIELMKGKIWFETQVGAGTTFFIELPQISVRQ